MIAFTVSGEPATKGSYRAIPTKGRVVVKNDNPRCKAWQAAIGWKARIAMGRTPIIVGPVRVIAEFRFVRPRKTKLAAPRQDLDKLQRALFDGMTGIVYVDDSQVTDVRATKAWGEPGVTVTVEAI